MKMDYKKSVELALSLGFERVEDLSAFNGEYFIKHAKKWIHWIDRLKEKLNVGFDEELAPLGYHLESFYKYRYYTNEMVDKEISRIKNQIENESSVLFGKTDILYNTENLNVLATLPLEGFDDEISFDAHHQMSKD